MDSVKISPTRNLRIRGGFHVISSMSFDSEFRLKRIGPDGSDTTGVVFNRFVGLRVTSMPRWKAGAQREDG